MKLSGAPRVAGERGRAPEQRLLDKATWHQHAEVCQRLAFHNLKVDVDAARMAHYKGHRSRSQHRILGLAPHPMNICSMVVNRQTIPFFRRIPRAVSGTMRKD